MIKSFKHKGLKIFFYKGIKKGIQARHVDKLSDILDIIDASSNLMDINYPGSGLNQLKPKKNKIWAVNVSGGWRVTFKFVDGDAYIIDYLNYH